jgi:triosephosphate isomerase
MEIGVEERELILYDGGRMIFVNFKTYKEGTGEKALELAKICEEMAQESGIEIIPVVQAADLFRISQAVKIPVWVQHLDWQPQGQSTGWINLEAVVEAGASGTLLNHSEHQIPPGTIRQVLKKLKNSKTQKFKNFRVMICCRTLGQAERLAKFEPDFLAYEPLELIGSQEKSVASEKPEAIGNLVKMVPDIPVIVGAGIHSQEDVKTSLRMGAKGVLVATDIVLAKDPKKELEDLTQGFKGI